MPSKGKLKPVKHLFSLNVIRKRLQNPVTETENLPRIREGGNSPFIPSGCATGITAGAVRSRTVASKAPLESQTPAPGDDGVSCLPAVRKHHLDTTALLCPGGDDASCFHCSTLEVEAQYALISPWVASGDRKFFGSLINRLTASLEVSSLACLLSGVSKYGTTILYLYYDSILENGRCPKTLSHPTASVSDG